jgi:hypothetical protein
MDSNTNESASPIHFDLQINTEDEYIISVSVKKEITLKI